MGAMVYDDIQFYIEALIKKIEKNSAMPYSMKKLIMLFYLVKTFRSRTMDRYKNTFAGFIAIA